MTVLEQLNSALVDEYKSMTRTALSHRETVLMTEQRDLNAAREEGSNLITEAQQELSDLHEKEAQLLKQLNEIELAKRAATHKLDSAAAGLALNYSTKAESAQHLAVVKFMLKYDANKPYATQPFAATQRKMRLTTVEDVQALSYRASLRKLHEAENLGLGEHPDFPYDSIDTRKGSALTAELHQRIISYLNITRSASATTTTSAASATTTTTTSLAAPEHPTTNVDDDEESKLLAQLEAVRKRKRASQS